MGRRGRNREGWGREMERRDGGRRYGRRDGERIMHNTSLYTSTLELWKNNNNNTIAELYGTIVSIYVWTLVYRSYLASHSVTQRLTYMNDLNGSLYICSNSGIIRYLSGQTKALEIIKLNIIIISSGCVLHACVSVEEGATWRLRHAWFNRK